MIRTILCCGCVLLFLRAELCGQEVDTNVFAANLKNPCGVAIRPATEDIYVCDTGRGRIVHLESNSITEVVAEFPVEEFELDRNLTLGPMALMFRKRNHLMVGTGGSPDGEDSLSVFNIEEVGKEPIKADEFEYQVMLDASGGEAAGGNFFSIAKSKFYIYTAGNSDPEKGWIARSKLLVNDFGKLERFIPSTQIAKVAEPRAITFDPDGRLVVAQMGTRDKPGDSLLTFYNEGGELLDTFPTGLNDIVAIAYGPRKKRLYALDFNWAEPKKGGLYKLMAVDSKDGCEAELIMPLERPTAMAFTKKGVLYVTVCGFADSNTEIDDDYSAPGQCLEIKGLD